MDFFSSNDNRNGDELERINSTSSTSNSSSRNNLTTSLDNSGEFDTKYDKSNNFDEYFGVISTFLSLLLAIYNLYTAIKAYRRAASDKNSVVFKTALLCGSTIWLFYILNQCFASACKLLMSEEDYNETIGLVTRTIGGRLGIPSIVMLLYTLVLLFRFRMLRNIISYSSRFDIILLFTSIAVFAADPVVFTPLLYIRCPTVAKDCVMELTFLYDWQLFMGIYYFLVELVLGLCLVFIFKWHLPRSKKVQLDKELLKRRILLDNRVSTFLVFWIVNNFATVTVWYFNQKSWIKFPFYNVHMFLLTIQYLLCHRFSAVISYMLEMRVGACNWSQPEQNTKMSVFDSQPPTPTTTNNSAQFPPNVYFPPV